MHVAAAAADDFPDGVFWVPLQATRDPALVEHTIAAALGADDGLAPFVGGKRLLVLLDNFEQVVDAAQVVADLVSSTPNAKVLVTSREPLHITGERVYPVEPLRLDEATLLFEERAAAVMPAFQPVPEVAAICERVDRLPLAIELAAARVVVLAPPDLLARLEERLPLLASRSRNAPERQKTLHATIEWSYELLDDEEQELFRRLSVFRGSFSLDAVAAICETALDVVESLLVKSLLRRRWETILEYARERFDESEERERVRSRHADYFLRVAESANLNAGDLQPGGQRLETAFEEQDNVRGAIAWCVRADEIELGLRLATAFEQFWVANDPTEGVRWYERLLTGADGVDPLTRAHALRSFGSSLHISGDPAAAERAARASLAVFEELDDEHGCAVLLHRLSITAITRGDTDAALELVRASHELHSRGTDPWRRKWGHAQTTGTMAALARDAGDDSQALRLFGQSAELAGEVGVRWWQGGMLAELAALSLRQGDVDAAERYAAEALTLHDGLGDRSGRVFGVGLHAAIAATHGDAERAGRLWGAIADQKAHAPLGGWERHRADCQARIDQLGAESFDAGLAAGRELELGDAVREALGKAPTA
jgi:predicted ATPase